MFLVGFQEHLYKVIVWVLRPVFKTTDFNIYFFILNK